MRKRKNCQREQFVAHDHSNLLLYHKLLYISSLIKCFSLDFGRNLKKKLFSSLYFYEYVFPASPNPQQGPALGMDSHPPCVHF